MAKKKITITNEMNELLSILDLKNSKPLNSLAKMINLPRAKTELLMHQLIKVNLVEKEEKLVKRFELTKEGERVSTQGLPENQILDFLIKQKTLSTYSFFNNYLI